MTPPDTDPIIDARELEPPEPFERTLAALDTLKPGQTLLLLLRREPFPLYRMLELNGIRWNSARNSAGDFEIRMWREGEKPLIVPPGLHCPDCSGA